MEGHVFFVFLCMWASCCEGRDFTFTFKLPAGKSECFYEYINEGAFMEIEYQVIHYASLYVTV